MTGEIILAGYGVLSLISTTVYVWLGYRRKTPVKPLPAGPQKATRADVRRAEIAAGGMSQTEFERLMTEKHGDNWPSLLNAWHLGDEL